MKYYIGKINEQYGEFEVEVSILFSTSKDPIWVLEQIARDWYGQDEHDSTGLPDGMYWNCGEMAYGAGNHHEITATTYNELNEKRIYVEMYAEENPLWRRNAEKSWTGTIEIKG